MDLKSTFFNPDTLNIGRRRFVKGVAAGGALLGLGMSPHQLFASGNPAEGQPVLRGKKFKLTIAPQQVNLTGKERIATAVNGTIPGPILRWQEGDRVSLDVTNMLAESSSIHWHGIILPTGMDGVPEISFAGISPGETFHYEFDVRQSGTY